MTRTFFARFAALAFAAASASLPVRAADVPVRIIGFNDFHGSLFSPGNFSGNPAGGVDYLAAYVKRLRDTAPNPQNTLVVHAGDMVGASPLVSALFHDEPAIEAMNKVGVDIAAVGNHEFDEGRAEILRLQAGGCHPTDANSCKGPDGSFTGAKFQFLAANVIDTATGRPVFPRYVLRTYGGVRMAFIGMTLEGTPNIVTPTGVAGLAFNDEAQTVNALMRTLRNQGVNAIVVIVHEGGSGSSSISGCSGLSGPIVGITRALDDAVDLIVSGHTHQAYLCNLPNAAGRNIPVTSASAFGRVLTQIDLVLDTATRDVKSVATAQVIVNRNNADITGDASLTPVRDQLKALADHYNALVAPIANRVIGKIAQEVTRSATAAGEHAAGDLIADAQLTATQAAELGGAQIAFMNPGGIRADFGFTGSPAGEGDGNVSYGEAFTVQPFGNSLVTMTLTGAQIETLLEQQFAGCPNNQVSGGRILQVSRGFEYTWNATGPACDKIDPASIKLNGVTLVSDTAYRVTVNSFMADGGDQFFVLRDGTSRLGGPIDLDALVDYFASTLFPSPIGTPYVTPPRDRIRRLN